jgi:crossover junction endonuclease MUS81
VDRCFTTEIAEGFDVQRTSDARDTMRLYGHLTHAISNLCDELSRGKDRRSPCKKYRQFVDDCKALEKERVSDVFGVMLMQVRFSVCVSK